MISAKNVKAKLSATKTGVHVINGEVLFGEVGMNEIKAGQTALSFEVQADSIEIEKFKLTVQDENKNEWTEFFVIPIKKDLPEIKEFEIADGKIFTVAKSGIDTETLMLGRGNGDGVANPGESLVILVKDHDKYWRTNLTFSDSYVNPFGLNKRVSDDWSSFDHVGASAKYSVPLISSDCPDNHSVDFFAEYWMPQYPLHIIRQGVIKIKVRGKDQTAPAIDWVMIRGDNIIQVKMSDGSKVKLVKARLILKDDPTKSFEVDLQDAGKEGDRAESDNVFSKRIPDRGFGIYRVIIEATDSFDNKMIKEVEKDFVLY